MNERATSVCIGVRRLCLSLPILAVVAGCDVDGQIDNSQPASAPTPGAAAAPAQGPLRGFLDLPSGRREVSYEVVDGVAIHDGDIILGDAATVAAEWRAAQAAAAATPGARAPYGNALPPGSATGEKIWPGGWVRYKLQPNAFTVAQQSQIFQAMATWVPAGVRFKECSVAPACSYYVYIRKAHTTSGSCGQSRIGMAPNQDNASYQNLILDAYKADCVTTLKAAAVHELGHAVGLYHEHQRSDRNSYIKVGTGAEILYRNDGNLGTGTDPVTGSPLNATGRYDLESVMHYRNGEAGATITMADGTALPSFTAGGLNGDHLQPSSGDLAAVVSLYTSTTEVAQPVGYLYQSYTPTPFRNVEFNPPPQAASMQLDATGATSYLAMRSPFETLVLRKRTPAAEWTAWQEMPGVTIHSGVGIAVNPATGGFFAAALSDDDATVCVHDGSTWQCDLGSPWPSEFQVDGFNPPAVGSSPDGDVWVVVPARDSNGRHGPLIGNMRAPDGTWSGWFEMLLDVAGTPSVVWTKWGLDIFYVAVSDGGVHDSIGAFTAWNKPKGVTLDVGLSVVSRFIGTSPTVDQNFDVFVRGTDNMIWNMSRHDGQWAAEWKNLGGPAYTIPAATILRSNSNGLPVDLFFGGPFGNFVNDTKFYDPLGLNNVIWHKFVAP